MAAAALLALAGCASGSDPDPTASPTQTISVEPEDPALAAYYGQNLTWTGCGGKFECATMSVPLTYDEPDGESIDVKLVRLPAGNPDQRLGSLVLNPGGPGGSGIEYARAARVVLTGDLLEHYDIVGFDPRGVADSTPIECLTDRQLDRFLNVDPNPETDEDVAAVVAVSKRFGPRCKSNSPELAPNIGTPFVVRDMDILRSLLGDDRLNYLGKSYGTMLGSTYAELFPDKVGRMVLDGDLPARLDIVAVSKGQADAFDVAIRDFVRAPAFAL